jgi:hypothetical protein
MNALVAKLKFADSFLAVLLYDPAHSVHDAGLWNGIDYSISILNTKLIFLIDIFAY